MGVSAPLLFAQAAADAGADASQRLSWIIIALVVLAVVIGIVTVVFWRLTSPQRTPKGPSARWVSEQDLGER
jgi:flagellar basal body-associated protein FliL